VRLEKAEWPGEEDRNALARGRSERDEWSMFDNEHQCPYCELRFSYLTEVKDHVTHDHPDHAHVVDALDPHELPHGFHGDSSTLTDRSVSHQCPYCELRLSFTSELSDHISVDHRGHNGGASATR
jgi:hypothetical protein